MNWTHVKRIAWKDYRRMSMLWYAIVGFWILCLALAAGQTFVYRDSSTTVVNATVMMLIIPFMAVIHGLSWAAVTFSAEHEDNTYNFLRSMPVDGKHVFWGKLTYGVTSTVSLVLALGAVCLVTRGILVSQGVRIVEARSMANELAEVSAFLFSIVPLALAVGVFWSLRVSRPLVCLVLTALCLLATPAVGEFAKWLVSGPGRDSATASPGEILVSSLLLGTIAAVFFFVDRKRVETWFPNASPAGETALQPVVTERKTISRNAGFFRLLWLQSKDKLIWWTLGFAGLCFSLWWIPSEGVGDEAVRVVPIFLLSGFLGVMVFRTEHSGEHFRFLAQLGVSPAKYWFSRILLPLCLVVLLATVGVAGFRSGAGWHKVYLFIGIAGAFGIGQLASMACSSAIVACAVTLVSGIIGGFWLSLCAGLAVPVWLGGAPLVVLPLVASFLRTSRWFQNTKHWKQWVVPMIPMVLLALAVPTACALYRNYEVPTAALPAEFETADMSIPETEGTRAYREAFSKLPNDPPFSYDFDQNLRNPFCSDWLQRHPNFVATLMSSIEKGGPTPKEFGNSIADSHNTDFEKFYMGTMCLLLSADQSLESNDSEATWRKLGAALKLARHSNDGCSTTGSGVMSFRIENSVYERLVSWAMATDTSVESVQRAAEFIDSNRRSQPPWERCAIADYRMLKSVWDDPQLISNYAGDGTSWISIAMKLPWERARSNRLLNYHFARTYELVTRNETQLAPLRPELANTTLLGAQAGMEDWFQNHIHHIEHVRRGAIYQLALIAYRREHEVYPTDLSSLRVGGEPLPDDVFAPGELMVIDYTGPYVRSGQSHTTLSDGTGAERHFLLPTLEPWDAAHFAYRKQGTSSKQLRREQATAVAYVAIDEEAVKLANLRERINVYSTAMSLAQTKETEDLLYTRLRTAVRTGELSERLMIVEHLCDATMNFQSMDQFSTASNESSVFTQLLTVLLEMLSEPNEVPVKAAIARIVEEVIHRDDEKFISRFDLQDRLSVSEASPSGWMLVPIENPNNGYYYERLSQEYGPYGGELLDDAIEMAGDRRFHGVPGKLVSADTDREFLEQAFPELGAYWQADSEAAEGESREVIVEFVLP